MTGNPLFLRDTDKKSVHMYLSDPANANRYAYAGSDPVNSLDPTGLFSIEDAVGTLAGVGVAGLFMGTAAGLSAPPAGLVVAAYLGGGCLGGMVADEISSELKDEEFNLADAGSSFVLGMATSGGIGKLFGGK